MTNVEPLIRAQLEGLMPLPGGSRRDWADVVERAGGPRRRSRRRLLLAVAVGVVIAAASGAGIAAALGAFSGGMTIAQARACVPSTVALTTPSGGRVLTGHTDAGVSCVAYEDANGAVGSTAGRLGDLPIGDVLPGKMQGVIFGLVPPVTTRSLLDRFRSRS